MVDIYDILEMIREAFNSDFEGFSYQTCQHDIIK